MRSFQHKTSPRRKVFLALSGSIEGQLREIFAKLNDEGLINQSQIAEKLDVSRSVINRRLNGHKNMTTETIADMVWSLGACIDVSIYLPAERPHENNPLAPETMAYLQNAPHSKASSSTANVIPLLRPQQYNSVDR